LNLPEPLPANRLRAPTVRSRLMLEVASELVGSPDWDLKQARIDLRVQGPNEWAVQLFASDGPDAVADVVAGRAHFAILNPATAALPALARLGLDSGVLSSIATVPSYDQLGLAVPAGIGVERVEDLAAAKPRLTISLRAQRNHSVHMFIADVLATAGLTLHDFETWGGQVLYHDGLPHRGQRADLIRGGDVDAVFDEGTYNWVPLALESGLRFLTLGDGALDTLERSGYRRSMLRRDRYPDLDRDVPTLDFSGFLIYTRADADPDLVRTFCTALHARRAVIGWQGGPSLPLDRMVTDAVDAPLPVALHPAAAEFWNASGRLTS
jgi:hypothetical protein